MSESVQLPPSWPSHMQPVKEGDQQVIKYNGESYTFSVTATNDVILKATSADAEVATLKFSQGPQGKFIDPQSGVPILDAPNISNRVSEFGISEAFLKALLILRIDMTQLKQTQSTALGSMLISQMKARFEEAIMQGDMEQAKAQLEMIGAGIGIVGAAGGFIAAIKNPALAQVLPGLSQSIATLATSSGKAAAESLKLLSQALQQGNSQIISGLQEIMRMDDQSFDQLQNYIDSLGQADTAAGRMGTA